jgi:hypothetical protein
MAIRHRGVETKMEHPTHTISEEGMFFLVIYLLRGGVPLLRALPGEISQERK